MPGLLLLLLLLCVRREERENSWVRTHQKPLEIDIFSKQTFIARRKYVNNTTSSPATFHSFLKFQVCGCWECVRSALNKEIPVVLTRCITQSSSASAIWRNMFHTFCIRVEIQKLPIRVWTTQCTWWTIWIVILKWTSWRRRWVDTGNIWADIVTPTVTLNINTCISWSVRPKFDWYLW